MAATCSRRPRPTWPTGVSFSTVGPSVEVRTLVELTLPDAVVRDGGLDSTVLFIDPFGNTRIAGQPPDLEAAIGPLRPGRRFRLTVPASGETAELPWAATFGDQAAGEALLYDDAENDGLAIAVNRGSAAERFGLAIDDAVRLEPA